MSDLIKIVENNGNKAVSARELHKILEASERFGNWIERQFQYGFIENLDYVGCKEFNNRANQELQDYMITIEAAKSIVLRQKTNKNIGEIIASLGGDITHIHTAIRFETAFGDMLDKITGFKWERQYDIDDGKYFLDFYLKDVLIIEYDEEQHRYSSEKDNERITYCRNWLSARNDDKWECPVIRVEKNKELEGLNRIIRHLAGFEMFDTHLNYKLQVCDLY